MTKTDWTPESQPSEEADPLSATGMFLSALGNEADQPKNQPQETAAPSVVRLEARQPADQAPSSPANPASAAAPPSSSGEFTKLFQTAQPPPAVSPQTPAAPPPASAPGEFTRIFVKPAEANPADLPPAPLVRSIPEPPAAPHAAPGAPRMKGFSSGASDSASVEGGFTQLFQTRPSAPAPAPTPRVQAFTPPTPAPPAEEIKWPRQPEFKSGESSAAPHSGSTSVTGLFASLGASDQRPTGQRQEESRPQPIEPFPSFSPAPAAAPSTGESGGVTRLIQRLSESERVAPPAEPSPTAAEIPAALVDSGPGEFTRMISASGLRTAASTPIAPTAAPPASAPPFAMPTAPPLAIPPLPKPAAAPAPPAIPAPRIELPKAPVPKPAPPALPAAPGKFQEMVPILLVVNTFLLLVLIVLVIFALKAK